VGARIGEHPGPWAARGVFEVASAVLAGFGGKAPMVLAEIE